MLETLDLLTTDDVMRLLRLKRHTVLSLVHSGRLAAIRISRKCFRFRREDVEKFVRSRGSEA